MSSSLKVSLILQAMDRITAPIRRMASNFEQATVRMLQACDNIKARLKAVGDAMGKIGKDMSIKLTAPIVAFGTAAVRQSASFEKMKASLKTVTGSQEAANAAFSQMLDFAATTPFSLEEVMGSYIKLKALGLDPSTRALKSFGNTSSAMGKSLDQFIEAVADASTGEFERLKEFGIKASKEGKRVTFTFQGQATTMKNTSENIQKYLMDIGENKFGGAMEEQMKTMSGAFANFGDSVSTALSKVGDTIVARLDLKKFTLDVANGITKLADAFNSLPEGMQSFIIKGALILAILGPVIAFIGQMVIGIGGMVWAFGLIAPVMVVATKAVVGFGVALLTTPIGWITLLIVGLAASAYLIIKNWDKVSAFFVEMWANLKFLFKEGVDFILKMLEPLFVAIDKVSSGIHSVTGGKFGSPATAGLSGMMAPPPEGAQSSSQPVPSVLRQKVDTGGTLRIKVEGGNASVMSAEPNSLGMDYLVDTGPMMGGTY